MKSMWTLNSLGLAAIALCAISIGSFAAESQPDDRRNAADDPGSYPDSKNRNGRWWWPEHEKGDGLAKERRGNGGRVFGKWNDDIAESAIDAIPAPPPVPIEPAACYSSIVLTNILFSPDSVELSPEGKAETDKVISEMGKFPGDTVTCIGHTDDTGTETYNQKIGLRRAQAVVDYMVGAGIAPHRVRADSKGETQPAVPNDTPSNRALNRRVVFEYKLGN